MDEIINYIKSNNLEDIITYLNNLILNIDNLLYKLYYLYNKNNLIYNINKIILLCQDLLLNQESNYKNILLYNINYITSIYDKDYINKLYDILETEDIHITNDITITYNNKDYIIKNETQDYEIINIDILKLEKITNINIYIDKPLIIKKLNIRLPKKTEISQNNNDGNRLSYIILQLNSNIFNNDIYIDNLTISGKLNVLFINTITSQYKIKLLNIINNYNLMELYLKNSILNEGKINLLNINKYDNFKIILTSNKIQKYSIYINEEYYCFLLHYYLNIINNKDFNL